MTPTDWTQRRSDWISMAIVSGHLAIVIAPVMLAAWGGSATIFAISYLWFSLTQNAIANLLHEAAHKLIFKRASWSENFGKWILAPFFLTNFELYRRRHWGHHRLVGTEYDTKSTYKVEFRSFADLSNFAMRCFVGVEAYKRFTATLSANPHVRPLTRQETMQGLIYLVVFHALFAATLFGAAILGKNGEFLPAFLNSFMSYIFVYLFGMASGTILLSTLRGIAEHQQVPEHGTSSGTAAIRNLSPTPVTRILFGAYGFCEHGTHHARPTIPYYALADATRELAKHDSALVYGPSYWGIIKRTIGRNASSEIEPETQP